MLTKGAKINAEAQRKQRRKEVNAKDSKRKPQITQISADFFCGICGFNNQIGENLCQSVDRDAKGAKDTKGAKGNAETQRKQRRRERKEKQFLCSL